MTISDIETEHPAIRALIREKCRNHGWSDGAEYAMQYLADRGTPFTANDLRDLMGDLAPEQPNAIGGLFLSWSSQRLIVKKGFTASSGSKSNGSMIFKWVGAQAA
ncbi:hypothetical protein ACEN2A_01730 [Corynebacterium auriscanis]|uniref:hypothetical protein n=1 Tax=Corynebacterium auriscanis TaxID=99807 RepID=UPI003CE6F029